MKRNHVLIRMFLSIGPVCLMLLVMPQNSPIHLPYSEYAKPIIAMVSILVLYMLWISVIPEGK